MYKCTNEECKKFDIAVSVQEAMVGERGYLCVWCVKPMKPVKSAPRKLGSSTRRMGKRRS
jgi:hypothetical protein